MKRSILLLIVFSFVISLILIVNASITTETADAGALTGTYSNSGGTFTNTQSDDTSYFTIGTKSKSTLVDAHIELNFSIGGLEILEGAITEINLSAVYCHDGSANGGSCAGTAASGTYNGDQNVEIYNFTGSSWTDIGNLRTDDGANEVQSNFTVGGLLTDFVEDSTNTIRTRFQMNFTTGSGGASRGFLNLDYITLKITYNDPPNITSLNIPANNSYFNTNNINFNFTVNSPFGFTNATIYGNWSGGWHANSTIFNTTINNGTSTNVTINGIPEGTYIWNVLVYDNASTIQSKWFSSNYTFTVDTTNPTLTLNSPANDTIAKETSRILNVTVNDNRNEIIVKIYGGNETSFFNNNSLLYKRTVANNTIITYNWSAPVLNVTPDTQLLMHFDLEGPENATFIHDETGKNNGTKLASGAPVWNESGKFGYALGFDGVDDMVSISDSNSLDLNESFSISFWTYPTNLSKNQTFLAKGSSTTVNYYIDYKNVNDGQVEFGFYNGAFRSFVVNASTLTANQWNLVTVTSNDTSNNSVIYINGVDKGNSDLDYDLPANSLDLKLGSFPGYTQNFTGLIDELIIYNKTLSSSEVTNISQLNDGNWYWRVDLNDTASNLNISETRQFTIGTIWSVSPTTLGSVSTTLDTNVSVGTLLINNTHANKNVTINITSDYSGVVTFNTTMPFNLTGANGNWTSVQINVTSPSTEGTTTINFNVTATDPSAGGNSIPASRIVPVTLIHTSGSPFLITAFETVPTTVSQNNTGITLKASVTNLGQGNAQNVKIIYELPLGWTNSSGALTSNAFLVNVNNQANYSITVDIAANTTAGVNTLYANVTGQNSTGSDIGSNLKTIGSANVTVNAVSIGSGPTSTPTSSTSPSGGGGGGGGPSSVGAKLESVAFSSDIEVVRGEGGEVSFEIGLTPRYPNSTLENLVMKLTGFDEQYISITPNKITKIEYGETKNFKVTLSAPSYLSYEEHDLKATIEGDLINNGAKSKYLDTRTIKLVIQELSKEKSKESLNKAQDAVEEMKRLGFNIDQISKLLQQAQSKFDGNQNKEVQILSQQILDIKEKAFRVNGIIRVVKESLINPKKISLPLGSAVANLKVDNNAQTEQLSKENVKFGSEEVVQTLNLAMAAFSRGDYNTAENRIVKAQSLLLLERKGNLQFFVYLYWHLIIIAILFATASGVVGHKTYKKSSIIKKIEDINEEEDNLTKLMQNTQKEYFGGEIGEEKYHKIMHQHQEKLAKIRKQRLTLRNRRIKMLKRSKILVELKMERKQVEKSIKKLQENYFKKGTLSESEFKIHSQILNERLVEIEEEHTTIELIKKGHKNKMSLTKK